MYLNRLLEPFELSELEWRIGSSGKKRDGSVWAKAFVYIEARAAQNRLDKVVGPLNWKTKYEFIVSNNQIQGVVCELSIRGENNEWVSKSDGAEPSDTEPFKGAISGAFKRSAVLWGIGRYLYSLSEGFVEIVDKSDPDARYAKGKTKGPTQEEYEFFWKPKPLPDWALPSKKDTQAKVSTPNSNGHAQWTNDQKKEYCIKRWNVTKYEALTDAQKSTLLITSTNKPYPEAIAELHQAGVK